MQLNGQEKDSCRHKCPYFYFGWEGKPKEIFRRILRDEFELIVSNHQLDEIQRVLNYQKFDFTEEQRTKFIALIYESATIIETTNILKIIEKDPDDNVILESAEEENANYVISGEEHLLKLEQYKNIKIVAPDEFLKEGDN